MASIAGFSLKLKPLFDGMMGAAKVLKDADKLPEYKTILDAYGQMHEMQGTIFDLTEKLREIEKELKEMRDTQASAVGGVRWANHFWQRKDDSPCCLFCWEKQKRLFHVIPTSFRGDNQDTKCPECGTEIQSIPKRSIWQMLETQAAEARELQLELEAFRASELEQG
jgi:hypothetical protein